MDQNYFYIIASFLFGFLIGRVNLLQRITTGEYFDKKPKPKSFLSKTEPNKDILINDSKFVTEVSTAGLEKSAAAIGETQVVSDDINSSAAKLAQLKRG